MVFNAALVSSPDEGRSCLERFKLYKVDAQIRSEHDNRGEIRPYSSR